MGDAARRDALGALGLRLEVTEPAPASACRPEAGSICTVHYTGRLEGPEGAVFDCSKTRSAPLEFTLGRGGVIRGWDIALRWLACGVRASLHIPAALAYGTKGKLPRVPPNANLYFEIQMVDVAELTPAEALLDAASRLDDLGICRALGAGADVDHMDAKGRTALMLAADAGAADCVVRLIEASADATLVGEATGVGAIHLAARSGCLTSAEALIYAGADPNLRSLKGNTALSIARDDPPMCRVLDKRPEPISTRCPLGIGLPMGTDEERNLAIPSVGWELLRNRARWERLRCEANPRCWLRLGCAALSAEQIDALPRVEVELWSHVAPRTAENFRCLCTGEKGAARAFGSPPLHFKKNKVHRIVPGQILQAGDITRGGGRGGESIYGQKFADEPFVKKHTRAGLLSMANSGRNSNSSQFFVTLDAMPHLDGKHVVFGAVTSGLEVILAIAGIAGTPSGATSMEVTIVDCGQI